MNGFLRMAAAALLVNVLVPMPARAQGQLPVVVNGVAFDENSCVPLAALRTVNVPALARDSVAVELVLVRGRRPIGGKVFPSVAAFNAFDVRAWLDKRRPPVAAAPGTLHEYPPVSPVLPGDRLCLLVGTLRNRRQLTDEGARTYRVYNVRLCADE